MNKAYQGLEGALRLIADIAYDYDGCKTVESLKKLIDEIRNEALVALIKQNAETTENTELKPISEHIKIKYIIKEYPDYRERTGHFRTYEDFGVWLCSHFTDISIIDITDK
jgi:hypothetical protein